MRDAYIDALCQELQQRTDYLPDPSISTIYFGGGTPSMLSTSQLSRILSAIHNTYNVRAKEITIECNPDDIAPSTNGATQTLCTELHKLGFNRISIGIQTLNDRLLQILQRRHTALQAIQAVRNAQSAGFDNISIDLMFGLPGQTFSDLKQDVNQILSLGIQHLSAYSLQYEDGTPLTRMLDEGTIQEADEELSRSMYEYMLDATSQAGFEHYEISNFSLPGKQSIHNSSYWHSIPYLGIGAGAHSFDGHSRQYNTESLTDYINGAQTGNIPVEKEVLTDTDRYNEYVFTTLRTRNGLKIEELKHTFGPSMLRYLQQTSQKHIGLGTLRQEENVLHLTRRGLFVSNDIMSDLMFIPNKD